MQKKDLELSFICPKSRDELRGFGARRYCDSCDCEVTVISQMTAADAGVLLDEADRTGREMCISYDVDAHGQVRFLSEAMKQQLAGAAAMLASATLAVASWSSALGAADRASLAPAHVASHPGTPPTADAMNAPHEMEVPDPNAAFDAWDYQSHDEFLIDGRGPVAVLSEIQEARNKRTGAVVGDRIPSHDPRPSEVVTMGKRVVRIRTKPRPKTKKSEIIIISGSKSSTDQ